MLLSLQETAADIATHKPLYDTMCAKCGELIARGVQDAEELQEKLDNVQQRWNALQVRSILLRLSFHVHNVSVHLSLSVCMSI